MRINDKLHTGECCRVCTPEKKEANGGVYCHGRCPDYIKKCQEAKEFKELCKKNKEYYTRIDNYTVDQQRKKTSYKERVRLKKK